MPKVPDTRHELATLLRSRIPLIVVETRDEPRVLDLIASLAGELAQPAHTPVFQWTITDGLRRLDIDLGGSQKHNSGPTEVLRSIRATEKGGVYVLLDFHPFLTDPVNIRLLKDVCQTYEKVPRTIVLLSHEVPLPQELGHFAARFELQFPSRTEREQLVREAAGQWTRLNGGSRVKIDPKAFELLVENLAGLSTLDTERLARKAIFNDGALAEADLAGVMEAKYQLLNRGGALSYEHDTAQFAELGGMRRLKDWLQRRRAAFGGSAPQLESPRGLLLLGVQGCGKSLAARAAAGVFGLPLLRVDFGALYNKYHGESERNLRDALRTADVMAPCVLWIDEIEKGLATGDGDSGTSRRVLGSFLTWLSEKKSPVFVVATANDITALPPELIRKGRFDEIFFVDLPGEDVRAEVLQIHLEKRGIEIAEQELRVLAHASRDFSGAELEQAVVSALYLAHGDGEPVSARHLLAEIRGTRPLATVMAERIESLRSWASGRTVPAD
jgi:SpoVK/Ycf46/Vps4 family AAA+-type ATPase